MSILDYRVIDAITKLHEAARVVEQDIGIGELSKNIRNCADKLHTIFNEMECGK
jgi:hypothetical protein